MEPGGLPKDILEWATGIDISVPIKYRAKDLESHAKQINNMVEISKRVKNENQPHPTNSNATHEKPKQ